LEVWKGKNSGKLDPEWIAQMQSLWQPNEYLEWSRKHAPKTIKIAVSN